jgi:hypothetical protein
MALVVTWLLAVTLCLVTLGSSFQRYQNVKTIGVDAAPSVVAAQRIKIALASLDVDVANELIAKPGAADDTVKDFDKWRVEVGNQLVAAAKNITYGDAEQKPIEAVQAGLSEFYMAVQAARDAHSRGDDKAAIVQYRKELDVLDNKILPNADSLEKANANELEKSYAAQHTQSWVFLGLVIASGAAMAIALLITQAFLRRRFHRRYNKLLIAATALSISFSAFTVWSFGNQMEHLRAAKEDAYNSVIALLEAKAEAYIGNASESRYLLDRDQAKAHEQTFVRTTNELATFSDGMNYEQAANIFASGKLVPKTQFQGRLADELNNVTYQGEEFQKRYGYGELDMATKALRDFAVYVNIDHKIRALETSGQHDAAIALCLGYAQGQSNWAFAQFDSDMDKLIAMNVGEMNRNTDKGFADLVLLPFAAPVVSLLIALLVLFGLRPRLREFDV